MANKNVINAGSFDFVLPELHLGSLSAIQEQKLLAKADYLRGMISSMYRNGRSVS